jgi:hypothetical protein
MVAAIFCWKLSIFYHPQSRRLRRLTQAAGEKTLPTGRALGAAVCLFFSYLGRLTKRAASAAKPRP